MSSPEKIRIGITGMSGQLGIHCRARFEYMHGFHVTGIDRDDFNNADLLKKFVDDADVILHLAAAIRVPEQDIDELNLELARKLTSACHASSSQPHLILCSSIHNGNQTPYGEMKRKVAELIELEAEKLNLPYSNLILPNLFGEFSRPNHNNFSGTFCKDIVAGIAPTIIENRTLSYCHYGEVADHISGVVQEGRTGEEHIQGETITVSEVAERLQRYHQLYVANLMPELDTVFDVRLFNMLRHFMFEERPVFELVNNTDQRGGFIECIRSFEGGQTSFSTSFPGVTRGNHFHFNKIERFVVVSGQAKIRMRKLYSEEVLEFDVSGEAPVAIDMPTMYTHSIENTGKGELGTLFWVNEHFDPQNPDTWAEKVLKNS